MPVIVFIFSILVVLLLALVLYTYRWNILNPNRSGKVKIDNLERTFIYHIPKNLKPNPKLIMVYHGSRLKAYMMQILTGHGFDIMADINKNAIIVYPQGYEEQWNDCRAKAPYNANKLNLDDVGFTDAVIDYFKVNYKINDQTIYAIGYSNGGGMVSRLANEKPGLFKALAIICSNIPVDENNKCRLKQKPLSLIYFVGEQDPIVKYGGGESFVKGKSFGFSQSVEESLSYWLKANECNNTSKKLAEFRNSQGELTALQTNYRSVVTSKTISFVKILDGGHTIPNFQFRIPIKILGNMNGEVNAPELIWDFFESN